MDSTTSDHLLAAVRYTKPGLPNPSSLTDFYTLEAICLAWLLCEALVAVCITWLNGWKANLRIWRRSGRWTSFRLDCPPMLLLCQQDRLSKPGKPEHVSNYHDNGVQCEALPTRSGVGSNPHPPVENVLPPQVTAPKTFSILTDDEIPPLKQPRQHPHQCNAPSEPITTLTVATPFVVNTLMDGTNVPTALTPGWA
ncbi:hypothetical protein BU15DRAFT_79769 [Melanogaster broomeanus]|nr:hypothetical protein BU15DRAFT_79769 [Melanogaster broomeanus]